MNKLNDKPLVEVSNVSRSYRVRRRLLSAPDYVHAVSQVSFRMLAGQTLAVVGESGSGKSTLSRMLAMVEAADSGSIEICGVDVAASNGHKPDLRSVVQMVFQDPFSSLNPRKTIKHILTQPLAAAGRGDADLRQEQMAAVLASVGLASEAAQRYPHMFSGGQRQRIAIARALMLQPQLIIADEPVSALDVSIQAQILNLMRELQEKLNVAYFFVSHDLSVVNYIADDVMVMYLGTVVEYGPRDRLFNNPRHPYTRALLAATPRVSGRLPRARSVELAGELPSPFSPPSGCPLSTRCPLVKDQCREERPLLRELDGRAVACHRAEELQ